LGAYFTNVPGLSPIFSNVLVTAFGPPTGVYCKPQYWTSMPGASGTQVEVRCFSPIGQGADTIYNLAYTAL